MAKDPAFLFYPGDWQGGTSSFTRPHKGAYIDLLMAQFNQGRLHINDIMDILGTDFDLMWDRKLKSKFKQDEQGLFYNERLDNERNKRKNFSESRRNNLKKTATDMSNHMVHHMENEIVIEDVSLIEKYGMDMLEDFCRYWNEPNKKGKLRWQLQETWSLPGRLVTWDKNNFNKKNTFAKSEKQNTSEAYLTANQAAKNL